MKISTEIASIAEIVGERKAVELCAKAEILLLCLPFLKELFSIFTEVTA